MAAVQITPDDAELLVRRDRLLSNPESAHPTLLPHGAVTRGHEGVVDADEKRVAPRGPDTLAPPQRHYIARVARVGEVHKVGGFFFYPRELLLSENVVKQFDGAIVTLGHDKRRRCVGHAVFPRIERSMFIVCDLYIDDCGHAFRAIDLGMTNISPGWHMKTETRSIEGKVLHVATSVTVDHIALCRNGAAGNTRIIEPSEEQREAEDEE